jgi:hypothetical protein
MKMVFDAEVLAAVPDLASVSDEVKRAALAHGVKDASETLVFARQLEHIKNRLYKKVYAELKGRQFVPMSNEAGPNKEFVTYRVWTGVTMAKLVTNYSTDFETVTAMAEEQFLKFHDFGNAYEFSMRDLQLAAAAGVQLQSMKAELARDGHELAIDEAIAIGVPQVKTYGLTNHPNIPLLSLTTGNWPASTGIQILADMESIITQMENTTLEIHRPNVILMSTLARRLIATKPYDSASGALTVLQVFQARNPGVRVESWTKLATSAASGTTGRIIAYKYDPTILEFEVGEEFHAYPAFQKGMSLVTPCMSRFAGVVIHQPLAISHFDNQLI